VEKRHEKEKKRLKETHELNIKTMENEYLKVCRDRNELREH
jgi:hypothetical protein